MLPDCEAPQPATISIRGRKSDRFTAIESTGKQIGNMLPKTIVFVCNKCLNNKSSPSHSS